MKKQNTLLAKTDAIENTHSAETPEMRADNHGITAWKKRKRGGAVEGAKPRHRMSDVPHRAKGGKVSKGKGSTVNVIIAPQGGAAGAGGPPGGPMPPHPPMMPPGAAPVAPPPRPMMAPPGAGPGGPPMMPPGGAPPPMMGRAKGGRVPMTAGAMSGEGRLEKIKEYGKNAKSGEGK